MLDLLASSGSAQIDEVAAGVVALLELHFPGRIAGHAFVGSCADGEATPLSDIDMVVVFRGLLAEAERLQFAALVGACKRISPRSLDIACLDEATVLRADRLRFDPDWRPVLGAVTLKHASLPIYGADLRPAVPPVPRDVYARTLMHFPYLVLAGQRGHPARLALPLDYPDPADEFFGYAGRLLRGPDGAPTPSTKRLVHASGFIASALVAQRPGAVVADKRTAVAAYRQHVGDEWAGHLEAVQQHCRLRWGYRVPGPADDRLLLRELCQRQLAFENFFMAVYRDYLLREQAAEDTAARQLAQERLRQIGG